MITCLALSVSLDVTYLVDSLGVGEIHRPRSTLKLPGGKALNVARAVANLGESAAAVAILGGHTGELIAHLLASSDAAASIEVRPIHTAAETRSCVTIVAADTGLLTEVYEPASPIDVDVWADVARAVADLRADDAPWLVVSGSIPGGVDLGSLARLLSECRDRGIRIAVDTHGAGLAALVGVHPDLVKVNRAEAQELLDQQVTGLAAPTGPAAELEALAAGIHGLTGGLIVVTDGAAGSIALDAAGTTRATAPTTVGRYSVGSGDTFLAGFLVAWQHGLPVAQRLEVASACAEANAAVPGAAVFDPADALGVIAR